MSVVNGVTVVMPPPEGYVVDFDNPQRQYVQQYHGVYIGGMTVMLFFVAQNLYVRPVKKAWDVTIQEGSCINVLAMFKSTATLGILTDLAILVWAIIEIQLLVICPSLCTLRAFARHLAPRLMGDYATTSAPVGSRYRKSFRTIGESSVPRKLNTYKEDTDDTMFHLRSLGGAPHEVQIEGQSRTNRAGSSSSDDTEANNRTFDPRPGDDLERAIIQTRSITITNTPA
ncbi:hypothetical protein DL770_007368 [Monosporascus sp. CRB-9-2]|nr:hypothetical protein DL770_007368 [Monosporascus sp. CRB-9-2]